MLEVENLSVSYGDVNVLNNLNFTVKENETVAIIGSNGMGKTTLLNTISGLIKPKSGKITFCDSDLTEKSSSDIVRLGISLSPEDRKVFPYFTVKENLEIGAYTINKNFDYLIERVYNYFPILEERKNQMAGTLSGGEQQMLTIGRSLMSDPKLLLLDEASLGLAPLIIRKIFDIIEEIKSDGTTILIVEQNAKMALEHSDRTYVLKNGQLFMGGGSTDLMNNNDIVDMYFGLK